MSRQQSTMAPMALTKILREKKYTHSPRSGRRRWISAAKVGLAASLLQSCAVPCLCSGNYGKVTSSSAGFISAGGGHLHPAPVPAPECSASLSARRWFPQGKNGSALSRSLVRPRQEHVTTASSGRRDHDDVTPSTSSGPGADISVEPRPTEGGEAAVGSEDCVGCGESSDSEVESLVDLVNLLHNSDNPLWELVRFEVSDASERGRGRIPPYMCRPK